MQEQEKFILADLRLYWLKDFAYGKDFRPVYKGWQTVETGKSGGVFIAMSKGGAPKLKEEFAEHMDGTSYGYRVKYEKILEIFEGMYREPPAVGILTPEEEQINYWHAALFWLAFDREKGLTQERLAEKLGVDDRTIRNWIKYALTYIQKALKGLPTRRATVLIPVNTPVYSKRKAVVA
jgi:hypothetical protein